MAGHRGLLYESRFRERQKQPTPLGGLDGERIICLHVSAADDAPSLMVIVLRLETRSNGLLSLSSTSSVVSVLRVGAPKPKPCVPSPSSLDRAYSPPSVDGKRTQQPGVCLADKSHGNESFAYR